MRTLARAALCCAVFCCLMTVLPILLCGCGGGEEKVQPGSGAVYQEQMKPKSERMKNAKFGGGAKGGD